MDPQALIAATVSAGMPAPPTDMPAPFWFIQLFKVLGFTLHVVPMNLWFAGLLLAAWLHCCGSEHGKRFAARLLRQMPILIAFGINFGIVPLLFLQVAYYRFFYPATILMAWHWLYIVVLLIPAYYGVYVYVLGLRDRAADMPLWRRAAGWVAAVLFVGIGFLFANGLSLMTNIRGWPALWETHSVAGAALGTGLNTADATLWPRWLLMFGLALGTTAAWAILDAAWLAGKESPEYKRWASGFAAKLITASVLWVASAGSWYVFGAWRPEIRSEMVGLPMATLTGVTAFSPGLVWLLICLHRGREIARPMAALVGLAQLGVLGLNAVSRQVVQNLELRKVAQDPELSQFVQLLGLKPYLDVGAQPVSVDWGPLVMFLATFVVGMGVVAWMVAQVLKAKPSEAR